jgi:hypothetical protein
MTARPAFGDFLAAARDHASAAAERHQADRGGEHVQEVTGSLLHLVLSGAQDSFGLACSRRLPFRWGTSARRLDGRRHLADDRPGLL